MRLNKDVYSSLFCFLVCCRFWLCCLRALCVTVHTYIQSGKTVVDVSVSHPPSVALRAASDATDGSAAARRNAEMSCAYNRQAPNGYPRVPFSVETYGRLGKTAIGFLGRLGAEAVAADNVSKSGFVAAALWELR
jgi:hypothetical protein